jgi:hypothetical protein
LDLTISSKPSDSGNPTVEALEIRNLSPWVKREVGDWLVARADEGDISAVGFALGRYWDVSMTRAQCWVRCCKELGDLVTCATENHRSEKANEKKKRGKKARSQVDEDEELEEVINSPREPLRLSKRELHAHLGRQELVLKNDDVVLRVSWNLQFDWTGEVESVVTANAACPQVCKCLVSGSYLYWALANIGVLQGKKPTVKTPLKRFPPPLICYLKNAASLKL